MFACRTLDSGRDDVYGLAHMQRALAKSGYWTQNMMQECYEGIHASVYVPAALVVLSFLSLGPPLASYLMLRDKARHDMRVRKVGSTPFSISLPSWLLLAPCCCPQCLDAPDAWSHTALVAA